MPKINQHVVYQHHIKQNDYRGKWPEATSLIDHISEQDVYKKIQNVENEKKKKKTRIENVYCVSVRI